MVSVHEENRWPRTGALADAGIGNVWNLPVPRGFNDDEMTLVLNELILPLLTNFGADAIVLQCGADAVEEDPQSRLSLSNTSHFAVVRSLMGLSERLLVTGGGGYNPWSVGRLWTGVWGVLNGHEPPTDLPVDARPILGNLVWRHQRRFKEPPDHWINSLVDERRGGSIRSEVRQSIVHLGRRLRSAQHVQV